VKEKDEIKIPGHLNRDKSLQELQGQTLWDIIVIGGGATGLGVAVDAASRGFSTLLLEEYDFAKGTSSRSTKLVHGGVRYLANGDIRLVLNALHERGLLLQNAAHLVKRQPFIIPCYSIFAKLKYVIGLKIYDWLSVRSSFGSSRLVSKNEMKELLPEIKTKRLTGGVIYFDGQFDDARLAINLAQTSVEHGATVLNYFKVTGLLKKNERVEGVVAIDKENNREYQLKAKSVINATGVFVDNIMHMDTPESKPLVRSSQGVHLVFDPSFLKGRNAVMIPKTSDGRVLFAVPWHQHVLVGTTDTPLDKHSIEPKALDKEINFILKTIAQYFEKPVTENDVKSVFAGLRPLAATKKLSGSTKEISRNFKLMVSRSGLISITGGKWTTYREMAEQTVNKAIMTNDLKYESCVTQKLKIHGCTSSLNFQDHFSVYGTDKVYLEALIIENPELNKKLIAEMDYTEAEVIWAVRNEMARTVDDVLARRLRMLFLNAKAAIKAAPKVAEIIATELNYSKEWESSQVENFNLIANNYLIESFSKITYAKH
jgi:glycerol-3-phosphate dehydrogenase